MSAESQDIVWLDARTTVTQAELAGICGLSVDEIEELVDYGVLRSLDGAPLARSFSAGCVQSLREASALRERFDLDVFVVGLLFSQFEQIARLEQQVRALQVHVPHAGPARDGPAPWREPHG